MFKRAKFYMIIFAIIFINFLTLDFLLIDVEKTALIVAIGVDKVDNEYEVTAQIAVPEASNQSTKSNESVIYAKGKTIYDAINEIGVRTGWYPKLAFCNLIILGNGVFEENVMSVIDFFIRSYKVEDSAILCASETTAKEVLLSISPLDNISSFALSKIFVRDHNNASSVLTTTVKEFSKLYYSYCKMGYMPVVKMVETKDKGDNTSQASSLTDNSGKSSEKDKNTPVVYDAETCYIFNNGYKIASLNNSETLFLSLFEKKANESYFSLEIANDNESNKNYLIAIKKVNSNIKLKFNKNTPYLMAKINLSLQIIDTDFSQSMEEIKKIGRLDENTLRLCEKHIETTLLNLYNKTARLDCDVFEVKNMLFRFHNDKFLKNQNDILLKTIPEFKIIAKNYI